MSRALARLRETTGDPLLVRAGRGLVPTPRAIELRERVGQLIHEVEAVLRPVSALDLKRLVRTFTLRNRDGFVETFGPELVRLVGEQAPSVRLRFLPKLDKESTPMREGSVDLETGVIGRAESPEVRAQSLFRDRFVGVVRKGHPLCDDAITPARYAAGRHILNSRRGLDRSRVDDVLGQLGLQREIVTVVSGFSEALSLARNSDLIATVPQRYTASFRNEMLCFELPIPLPDITISLLWHPRLDADPGHRWLRECVHNVCNEHLEKPLGGEAKYLAVDIE